MSSSSLFRSVLLSKPPRVGYFHGSHINSAEFVVSSRFSGVKFNASPCSNLKVKSFMCCSAKVQNFVKSTSKIANFGEADENYFEKVLIVRILKALKWLKIPAVLVLLLTMTMSGRRGYSALAASCGVIGWLIVGFLHHLMRAVRALNQIHSSFSTVVYILQKLLLLLVLVCLAYEDKVKSKRSQEKRVQTHIFKLEVGIRIPVSYDFDDDDEIIKPSKTKSSYSMFTHTLRETAGVLRDKYMPFINNGYLSVQRYKSREDAEAYYLKLSNEEQNKFNYLDVRRKLNLGNTNTNRRGIFNNNSRWTHVVVTILVAAKGEGVVEFPNEIGNKRDLGSALLSFKRMSLPQFGEIQAFNVFWTPMIENYGLTDTEVLKTYPHLHSRKIL